MSGSVASNLEVASFTAGPSSDHAFGDCEDGRLETGRGGSGGSSRRGVPKVP